ncbi:unnamed protein product [Brassica rapa subsp. trilocularis]
MYRGMWQYPRNSNLCCIYRVPKSMRDVNPEAYTPQFVLIGPLHHSMKSQALKALEVGEDITYTKSMGYLNMEEHKKVYLAAFGKRLVEGGKTIDEFRKMIKKEEEAIRASYSESTTWINSPEFVKMVLHDSVFIIEFMMRYLVKDRENSEKIGDPLMDENCLTDTIFGDLILLENQLPYLILENLFDPIVPSICPLVHVETLPTHEEKRCKPIDHMYNADKLDSGGVKFKNVGEEFSIM